eukprot:g16649.t3
MINVSSAPWRSSSIHLSRPREELQEALAKCGINGSTVHLAEAVVADSADCTRIQMRRSALSIAFRRRAVDSGSAIAEVERVLAFLERYAMQLEEEERRPASALFWDAVTVAESFGCSRSEILNGLSRHMSVLVKATLGITLHQVFQDAPQPPETQAPRRPVLTRTALFHRCAKRRNASPREDASGPANPCMDPGLQMETVWRHGAPLPRSLRVKAQRAQDVFQPVLGPLTYQGPNLIDFAQQKVHESYLLEDQMPMKVLMPPAEPQEVPREVYAPLMSVPRPSPCFAKTVSSTVLQRPVTREELERSGNFAEEGAQLVQPGWSTGEPLHMNCRNMVPAKVEDLLGMNIVPQRQSEPRSKCWMPSGTRTFNRKHVHIFHLGEREGPQRRELEAAAAVVAESFFLSMYDAGRTKQTEVSYDLDGDYIVAVEQGAVGHSGSLGVQLLFFTAKGQVLTVAGRKHEAPPSRVRFEVHPAEQVVGLEVEFGRIVGIQSALIPVDSDLEVNS